MLTGDTVTFTANPGVFGPVNVVVGAGDDLVANNFRFDMNAGAAQDHFTWISTPVSGDLSGSQSITIGDLDFSDASTLVDFIIDSTLLSGVSVAIGVDSVTISYTSTGPVGPGVVLDGRFVTTAAVPAPATLPLLLTAIAALGVTRRSKARSA